MKFYGGARGDESKQPNKTKRIDFSIKRIIFICALALLLVWGFFYLYTSHLIKAESQRTAVQLSGQMVTTLQAKLLELERVSFLLSQSPEVKAFVSEKNAWEYHRKSTAVKNYIHTLTDSSLVQNLILYSDDQVFYRFQGDLSSTSATRVYYELKSIELPSQLQFTLDGEPYIGYASGIYEENKLCGSVVILFSQQRLKDIFFQYGASQTVAVALLADGVVLADSKQSSNGPPSERLASQAEVLSIRKIGATPFEVLVYTDKDHAYLAKNTFALAALATAVLFIVLIAAFIMILNRRFFRPMLMVMRDVESLNLFDSSTGLAATGESAFDPLVKKINAMLIRLDESGQALREADAQRRQSFLISLKKQINAHFTVNVLHIIKLLAERQEMEKVYKMCDGLSHLLRYAHAGDEFIGGMEEFYVLQKYIDIMQIRLQDSFTVEMDLDDRLENVVLPRMLVQPLLENAIIHGFQEQTEGGRLIVRATLHQEHIAVEVSDNGCGIPVDELAALTRRLEAAAAGKLHAEGIEHVALLNIARRITSYYGTGFGLHLENNEPMGLRVIMRLGLHPQKDFEP